VIVRQVNRSVMAGQRIGILGANGQGKSTLVKTIARVLTCTSGTVSEGKGLNIGYFAQQELDVLRPHETPLQHMVRWPRRGRPAGQSDREQDLRSFLGTFNFTGDMVKQTVGTMSGGEKARLVLCMIVWQRPNLLLLDEPTNHLDLATREALAMALNEFEGTVMLVSHDRSLLRSVCDEFWLVTRGGMEDFRWRPRRLPALPARRSKTQPRQPQGVRERAKQPLMPGASASGGGQKIRLALEGTAARPGTGRKNPARTADRTALAGSPLVDPLAAQELASVGRTTEPDRGELSAWKTDG
jgi:ABC-type Mn2+/Zn2+ transport system ATPase subunit